MAPAAGSPAPTGVGGPMPASALSQQQTGVIGVGTDGRQLTEANIDEAMTRFGMTRDEVMRELNRRGVQVR